MKATPIFIVGVGRSGTSLLQSMLHAHPSVSFLPETQFYRKYVARPAHHHVYDRMKPASFRAVLEADEEFARTGIDPRELIAGVSAEISTIDVRAVYRHLLEHHAAREQVPYVGDKDPRNIDYLPTLHQQFPSAFIVHIMRDPRDVFLSRKKAAWSAERRPWLQAALYNAQLKRGRRYGPALFGENYIEVKYEQLITEPRHILTCLCERLSITFREQMLAFGDKAQELVDEKEMQWKGETLGPLLSDNHGKWRAQLSPKEIGLVETLCPVAFDEVGYRRSEPNNHERSFRLRLRRRAVRALGVAFETLYPALVRVR